MNVEMQIQVKAKFVPKYEKGYPLIMKESILNNQDLQDEGTIIRLVDERNHFIARGYFGKQNKGYGWLLTRSEHESINTEFFVKKIRQAFQNRQAFFENPETTAFRFFNGEGDGIGGIIIDYYDGHYVINWYSKGIYTFKEYVINALQQVVKVKSIYEKKRFDTKGQYVEGDDFVLGEQPEFPLLVKENGVRFAVYLNDGAMVGVFLDQRDVRRTIRDQYAKGKHVLNMFSYTGAFSVFAALGGATRTTSVDLANRSLPKTEEQFRVNGIDPEKHNIVVMDVFHYFKYAIKKNLRFDMVILDPPSFAKSKKFTFSAAKDYQNLLKETIQITEDHGIIVASTNCSTFDMKKFKQFIDGAFRESNERYRILEQFSLPEDFKTISEFKEGNYLKVVFIQKG
ncbi:class I SAM-dependent rRNA methyltransferase [Peribacillus asahii]|uniref:50S rRNA methyltransferase n=1 Tax=Peribacillus asahii TaxID=228899 RepID=A0A3T0KYZ6_9BACI|nr:class I SAM-dependent rRNA methyltransferase [Peribacillus asahii]AZV45566.1 50S rRNA methyltransferase [Peribacillus asahii]USK85125.1 class I SAM-dependent rRNA methyltransferase [Peribacillus asahii]